MKNQANFDAIYETLIGQRVPDAAVPGIFSIADGDTPYSLAWTELFSSRDRLCSRFGIHPEDQDLERIFHAVTTIEREITFALYHNLLP